MGLELRADSGNIYLNAQIFTGFMYIGAALCMWFLRAWKIRELQKLDVTSEKRGGVLSGGVQGEGVAQGEGQGKEGAAGVGRPALQRKTSRGASVKQATKGLWSLQRV